MLGALASRTTGIYFLMLTLTYAVIGYYVFGQVTSISGFGGITGVNPPGFFDTHPARLYYAVLVLSVVAYLGFRALRRTPFGLALEGIRDDPIRMSSLGFNVPLHRTLAFAIAGFVAGLAGVINIWWNGQIDPNSVNIGATLDLFIVAVIGGISHLEGAWLGAFVFVIANNYMRSTSARRSHRDHRGPLQHGGRRRRAGHRRRLAQRADGADHRIAPIACAWPLPDAESDSKPVHNNHGGIHMNNRTARRGAVVASLALVGTVGAGTVGATTVPAGDGEPLRLGILAECEGAFGGFNEDVVAGVTLAMVNAAGATVNSTTTALDGFTGAVAGGRPIEVVGVGCGDDTADRIIQEVRTLVEQENAEIVIGPLSGDEAIAVANYAKDHPEVTFIDGIAGSQEPTLQVQAENYFRFHGDGAQWNAGLGDRLYNDAGWRTVAVIADDYSFGWTSAAGFIADFCAVGGDVVTRVFPPLGHDRLLARSSSSCPIPTRSTATSGWSAARARNAALEAFVNAKGDLTGDQHAGNLFFSPALASALGPDIAGAYIGGFAAFPGDVVTPEIDAYKASADATWETLVGGATGGEPAAAVGRRRVRLHVRLLRRRSGAGAGPRGRRRRPVRRPRRVP